MQLNFKSQTVEIADFRADNPIQSMADYIAAVANYSSAYEHFRVVRCSISGAPQTYVTEGEWVDLWLTGLHAMRRQDVGSDSPYVDPEIVQDTLDSIALYVEDRLTIAARPSPALLMENGSYALAHINPTRQLAVLLGALFIDSRYLREKFVSAEDHVARLIKLAALFDWVDAEYDESMDTLRKALLFLDSQYRISHLQFRKHEIERFKHITSKASQDVAKITAFVYELTAWRTTHADLEVTPRRWTQVAMANEPHRQQISEVSRRMYSNVYEAPVTGRVATRGGNKPKATAKPKTDSAPATQAKAEKAARVNMFTNLFASMKGPAL